MTLTSGLKKPADHGLPNDWSKEQCQYWAKSVYIPQIRPPIKKLEELIERNNVALNSELMSLVSVYIEAANEVARMAEHMVGAYNPENRNSYAHSSPEEDFRTMHRVFKRVIALFHEAKDHVEYRQPQPLTDLEMMDLIVNAQGKSSRFLITNKAEVLKI